jgi:hypothetical protein
VRGLPIASRPTADRVLFLAIAVPWVVCLLGWGTDAGMTVPVLLISEWGGAVLAVLWLLRLWLHGRTRVIVLELFVLVVVAGLVWSGIGFRARFTASRPALARLVGDGGASIRRGEVGPGSRVGLFRIREAQALDGGIVRLITTECMFDDCGVAYNPDGTPPPRVGEDTYGSLGGGWWHWWRSW